MEIFVVLICCAIAAALGFFIGAVMRTSSMVTLSIENRKLREPIKSEVQETTVRNGSTIYTLRDGTEITFDELGTFDGLNSVVTIDRGDGKDDEVSEVQESTVRNGARYVIRRSHSAGQVQSIDRGEP